MSELSVLWFFFQSKFFDTIRPPFSTISAGVFVALSTYVGLAEASLMKLPDCMLSEGGGDAMDAPKMSLRMPEMKAPDDELYKIHAFTY
jgi:hypothetical protein